jgi:hypothetical protein
VAGLPRVRGQFRRIKGRRDARSDRGTWRENLRRDRRAFPPRTDNLPGTCDNQRGSRSDLIQSAVHIDTWSRSSLRVKT